jgi:hypothetical protein
VIELTPSFLRHRRNRATGGILIRSFLGEAKAAQAGRLGGFGLLVLLAWEADFYMHIFFHLTSPLGSATALSAARGGV